MEKLKEITSKYQKNNLDYILKDNYVKALKDENFKKLINKLKLNEDIGMKYTSKLENTVEELKNCTKCKHLIECKNKVNGCVYYPTLNDNRLEFNYVACKYKNKELEELNVKKSISFGLSEELKNAHMSDIDINDTKRIEIIKWLKNFYDNYPKDKKGLFLHGSFGAGKTYLIAALLNELAKKDYKTILVYYPELLTKLKSSFDNEEENNYSNLLNSVKQADILLLDDIGAETVTNWSRDEILGTILQYRMENNLSTFITSNLNLEELEIHLSLAKNSMDKVKARRIIERVKQLTQDIELVSKNRRNEHL